MCEIQNEDFRNVQSYMNSCSIETARIKFSLRGKMYKCRANYHGNYYKEERGCSACSEARGEEDDRIQGMGQDRPVIE